MRYYGLSKENRQRVLNVLSSVRTYFFLISLQMAAGGELRVYNNEAFTLNSIQHNKLLRRSRKEFRNSETGLTIGLVWKLEYLIKNN